jgi:hypothetical protein
MLGKTNIRDHFPPVFLSIISQMQQHHSKKTKLLKDSRGCLVSSVIGSIAAVLLVIFPSQILAQSATSFDTQTIAPEAPAAKTAKPVKPLTNEAPPANTTPSRQIGPAELSTYVTSLASTFSSRERATDPFGQLQDPDAKPVIKAPVAGKIKRAAPIQATPFADIVRLIVVTTIMPGEKRFLVGTRSIRQGDQIPLTFRGKQMRVQVTDVTSQRIDFKNLDNGETASRKLDMLPVGMTPGNKGITAPGMQVDRANPPLELEMSDSLP